MGASGTTHGIGQKYTGTTASHGLARRLFTLALRCGLRPSWKYRQRNVDIYFASEDAQTLGWPITAKKFRSTRRIIAGHLLVRIRAIAEMPYRGMVFDLDVDGDDVFTAPYVLVHDCQPPLQRRRGAQHGPLPAGQRHGGGRRAAVVPGTWRESVVTDRAVWVRF